MQLQIPAFSYLITFISILVLLAASGDALCCFDGTRCYHADDCGNNAHVGEGCCNGGLSETSKAAEVSHVPYAA